MKNHQVTTTASHCIVLLLLTMFGGVVSTATGEEKVEASPTAKQIAEEWVYEGDGTFRGGQSIQQRFVANETKDFCLYNRILENAGSFEDAWKFYCKKCGAKDAHPKNVMICKDNDDGNRFAVVHVGAGKQQNGTFSLHTKEYTVTVNVTDLSKNEEKTELHIQIVCSLR